MIIIQNMGKPKDCTECPICDEYDECMLQPVYHKSWDSQYNDCPLVEVSSLEDLLKLFAGGTKMRIYISGPISGREPEDYKAQFGRAAEIIRGTGNEAINPAECSDWGLSWDGYMKIARAILGSGEVDAIYMLRGWNESPGAARERFAAMCNGIPVVYQDAADKKRFQEM